MRLKERDLLEAAYLAKVAVADNGKQDALSRPPLKRFVNEEGLTDARGAAREVRDRRRQVDYNIAAA